jgi:hypothetical protein
MRRAAGARISVIAKLIQAIFQMEDLEHFATNFLVRPAANAKIIQDSLNYGTAR